MDTLQDEDVKQVRVEAAIVDFTNYLGNTWFCMIVLGWSTIQNTDYLVRILISPRHWTSLDHFINKQKLRWIIKYSRLMTIQSLYFLYSFEWLHNLNTRLSVFRASSIQTIAWETEWMNEWKVYSLKQWYFYKWEQVVNGNEMKCTH